jgi:hypothetical protein
MLMGIGIGTALGAAAIDVGKRQVVNREQEVLEGLAAEIQTLTRENDAVKARIAAAQPGTPQDVASLKALTDKLAERNARRAEAELRVKNASSAAFTENGSDGFLLDLLSDANGVTFHRFQMFAWTVVLGFLFCVGVYKNLAMPEFGATLLALMGISSGTYLGFKIPEAQSK